jgi:hypothetical protein
MLQSDGCIGGVVVGSGGVSGAVTGNKILSARERLTNCFWLWHQHGGQHGHSATTRNEFVRCADATNVQTSVAHTYEDTPRIIDRNGFAGASPGHSSRRASTRRQRWRRYEQCTALRSEALVERRGDSSDEDDGGTGVGGIVKKNLSGN